VARYCGAADRLLSRLPIWFYYLGWRPNRSGRLLPDDEWRAFREFERRFDCHGRFVGNCGESREIRSNRTVVLSVFFCATLSLAIAMLYESRILPAEAIGYLWPIVSGVVVVGIAYTLQVIIMNHAELFSAALILSLEVVFGAFAGYLWLSEKNAFSGYGLSFYDVAGLCASANAECKNWRVEGRYC
jgi:hypothetical protein